MAKKYKVGYTQGVYDMFHIGHLNLLQQAAKHCEKLIVGVNSDTLVYEYKKHYPVISETDRVAIISGLKCVCEAYIVHTLDKEEILRAHSFDAIFIGDDWKGNARWKDTEEIMAKHGVEIKYLPYTKGVSSTALRERILKMTDK